MQTIILALRELTDANAGDVEVNGIPYWTDEQLQTVLDQFRTDVIDVPLRSVAMNEAGVTVFKRYYIPTIVGRWIENDDGTNQIFSVVDTSGNLAPAYTYDSGSRLITFTVSTNGLSYFLRCRFYDIYAAASDVWYKKASQRTALIDWKAGGQSLSEDQEYQHCLERGQFYSTKHGITVIRLKRGDYGGENRF